MSISATSVAREPPSECPVTCTFARAPCVSTCARTTSSIRAEISEAAAYDPRCTRTSSAGSSKVTGWNVRLVCHDASEEDAGEEYDTVGAEEAREEVRPRKPRPRRYKIQEVIKVRQILLVQVVKEAVVVLFCPNLIIVEKEY